MLGASPESGRRYRELAEGGTTWLVVPPLFCDYFCGYFCDYCRPDSGAARPAVWITAPRGAA